MIRYIPERYILSDNARIYYQRYGEGVPLILLHGNHQTSQCFQRQIAYFSSFMEVIAIDSRGHGKSELQTKRLTLDTIAKDTIRILEKLNLSKCFILGFSDGGNVGLKIAMEAPERLYGIVCIGSNLNPRGLKWWFYGLVIAGYALIYPFHKWSLLNGTFQKLSLIAFEPNLTEEQLRNIALPALIVTGDHDYIKQSHSISISESLPKGELFIIKGGKHNVLVKNHILLNQRVKCFFDKTINLY